MHRKRKQVRVTVIDNKTAWSMGAFIFLAVMLQLSVAIEQQYFINDNLDSLYSTYSLIEDTITSDPKLCFIIKKAFFPAMNYRYWQLDGAEVIPIDVCVTFHETLPKVQCNSTGTLDSEERIKQHSEACWIFQWTNSLLLNLIPVDTLLAMDTILTGTIYSDIVESRRNRELRLSLQLNGSLLPCHPTLDHLEQTLALYFSSVCICMDVQLLYDIVLMF